MNFGSVCSGIEAASLALKPLGFHPSWFSEVATFPNRVLNAHYPTVKNWGDMNQLPKRIRAGEIDAPDMLCGGTPCQAFSLAGWKNGLVDTRGQLTLAFIDVADAIDARRIAENKPQSVILWENVEGVLNDKTNAFGIFISALAGLEKEIENKQWSTSGVLYGPKRNIAWRVLDAKYFGLPQQRRRLFLFATDCQLYPEKILFEQLTRPFNYKNLYNERLTPCNENQKSLFDLQKVDDKGGLTRQFGKYKVEVFREYTDCLYSAYGTKWNGNAAAYNGSLYISQNERVRRLTPTECEKLMGFPGDYTLIPRCTDTNRYQAIGNSWPIPVIRWLGRTILDHRNHTINSHWLSNLNPHLSNDEYKLYLFNDDFTRIDEHHYLNNSPCPNNYEKGNIFDIIELNVPEKFFISPKGSDGILRRKQERAIRMNARLEALFLTNSAF